MGWDGWQDAREKHLKSSPELLEARETQHFVQESKIIQNYWNTEFKWDEQETIPERWTRARS